ncbi:MAG: hypothetical protein N2512_08955, partial [Armatimonadetes bacterium]|nr:hypothetical protein [Armatimonadota bacterium]
MRRHKNARYRGLAVLLALLIVAYLGTRHLSGSLDPQYAENESDFAAANQPFSQSRYLAQHYGREWTYGEPAPAGIPPQSGPPPGVWYPPAKSGEPDAPTGMVPPQKAANQERSTPVGTAERIDNQTAGSTTRPAPPAGKTTTVAQSPTGGPKATDSNRAAKRRARRASTAERRPYIVRYEPITPITPIIPDYPSSDLMRRLYLPEYPRLDAMPGLQVPSYPRPDGVPQPQPPQRTGPDVLPGTQPPDSARPGVLPQPQAPDSTRPDVVPQPQPPDPVSYTHLTLPT